MIKDSNTTTKGEGMKDKLNCASIVGKPNFAVAHENVKPVDKMIFFKGGRQLGKSYYMRGVVEDLLKIQELNNNSCRDRFCPHRKKAQL